MFVEKIFQNLQTDSSAQWMHEVHENHLHSLTKKEFSNLVQQARQKLQSLGIQKNERVVLLGSNSAQWIACDLAIISMGAITVPLYSRQDAKELAFMAEDSQPTLFIYSTAELKEEIFKYWKSPCTSILLSEVFLETNQPKLALTSLRPEDPVTIIYTSGTSGHPKGVVLNSGNVDFMLQRTTEQLYLAKGNQANNDRVFHFLPLCFAGSRIMLWTQLYRNNAVYLSMDLKNLAQEMPVAAPEFYLNVPAVLERIRTGVGQKISEKGGLIHKLYQKAIQIYFQPQRTFIEKIQFSFLSTLILRSIRKKIGKNLKFLICGSAALASDTQQWFHMIGIPILQVYGLTETTAIITMDHPDQIQPGFVGKPIDGVKVKLSKDGELLCKGPNVFSGYWNRPQETVSCFDSEGWFRTGDLAEITAHRHLKITGRTKNLIIPTSGHNIVPEPIEELFQKYCSNIEHAVLVGHGKPYLSVIVTGNVSSPEIETAIEKINQDVPHYRKIKTYYHYKNGFTIENGFLTANQKIKRKSVEQTLTHEIETMYAKTM